MTTIAIGTLVAEVQGDGFPVIMLHGLGGSTNLFHSQLAVLGSYRVIRIDLPGSARSPRPIEPLSMEAMTGAVITAVRSLGVAKAHFVGHSMGTIVCQRIAADEPALVASLTLFGALPEPADATREALPKRAKLARSGGISDIADQIVANGLSAQTRETNPAAVAYVRESIMRQDPESYAQSCEALAKARAVDLRLMDAPTLLATGDADTVNPVSVAQAMADKIKGATLRTMDRCGHWATIEKVQECNQLLADFLRRVDR
jgi:pimeloyl-ACP methyl ester carboxylesterase